MTDMSILVEHSDGIGWLTINRPESLNALNSTVLGELASALKELGQDDTVKVVVITGATASN